MPSPSFGGFGFIGVASHLSIVAGWQIGSRSSMSILGRFLPVESLSPDRLLPGQSVPLKSDTFSRIDILTILSVHYLLGG